jgi:peroxiredoxin Q/BCP
MAKFPEFSLPGTDGRTWSLEELAGKPFIAYFYPKDMTPGCTTESCDFRDRQADLSKAGVTVLGISPDPIASHQQFIAQEKLNFVLLADEGAKLAQQLGVWVEKNMYGRTSMGIERSTFLVGPDGEIAREWRKVKVPGHADEVAAAARALAAKR